MTLLSGDKRHYKIKNPTLQFYCPLCRSERTLTLRSRLTRQHYIQIAFTGFALMALFYPLMGIRSFIWPFFTWVFVEGAVKIFFRNQVPCPHCGFDATWYKRDVRIAKKLVKDFWQKNMPAPTSANTEESEEKKLAVTTTT